SLSGFALRFWGPMLTLGSAWVLFNQVYRGVTAPEFGIAAGPSGYLSFIVIGNAFYVFVFAAAFVVGRVMFWERAMGTIEATFMTPMNRLAYMTGVMTAAGINSLIDLTAVFFIGLLFGFQAASFNIALFFAGLLLTAFALFGIGLMANAITLSFRDRTTTSNSLMMLFLVFSGVVCPVELMPAWAQMISKALPLTYGIRIMRGSLLGIEFQSAFYDLIVLFSLGIFFVSLGALTLRLIERNLKKKALFSVF
ncbi:MAG: ABC transporter permease, partial [Candidatus Bathyarchaeota archaeon]|nr:ABC transporter permease [Candidatus Bathyarchaeota archaeon]